MKQHPPHSGTVLVTDSRTHHQHQHQSRTRCHTLYTTASSTTLTEKKKISLGYRTYLLIKKLYSWQYFLLHVVVVTLSIPDFYLSLPVCKVFA
ncbi:hypothetical protein RRG08_052275 [Elysia crispata]|uniref:Uncharacterized protein n=1 Tax=Elysia crispata TaxID=231223 RepID=A0AAE0ZZF9_9GAST|nr:hypothetical protein RRG08_052275 [Elysia crispata]